jgi:sugar/nucleoside kinase (ribokinase family)
MSNFSAFGLLENAMNITNNFDLSDVPVAVGTGLVALDVVINHTTDASQKVFAGGTCGNVLTILSYLGWLAYPVARMNEDEDEAAKLVLADLKKWGVRTDLCNCLPSGETPIIIQNIRRAKDGKNFHRFSFTCPSCGAWLPGFKAVTIPAVEIVLGKVPRPNVFFFDRLSRAAVNLAKHYAENGVLVMFEPSGLGNPKLFREVLPHVHILKYANECLNEMSGLHYAQSPLLVIETMGGEGLRYRSNLTHCQTSGWHSMDSFSVTTVIDAAGAGDWCSAGILKMLGAKGLVGLLKIQSKALHDALLFGQALAAWNCQFEGARGGMYAMDKPSMHRQLNKILLGEANKFKIATQSSSYESHTFRCAAPNCKKQIQGEYIKQQSANITNLRREKNILNVIAVKGL